MLLQKQIKREAETAFGQASCAAMACLAIVGKQPGAGLAGIEILRLRGGPYKQQRTGRDQTAPVSPPRRLTH